MTHISVTTQSGSVYTVEERDGRFYLSGDNVTSHTSCALADGEWEVERPTPWPPVVGERWFIPAKIEHVRGTPERVPGGGKDTSPVREVRVG